MGLIELASLFNKYAYVDSTLGCFIIGKRGNWVNLDKVSTIEMQSILKVALNKVSSQNHNEKLGIEGFDK